MLVVGGMKIRNQNLFAFMLMFIIPEAVPSSSRDPRCRKLVCDGRHQSVHHERLREVLKRLFHELDEGVDVQDTRASSAHLVSNTDNRRWHGGISEIHHVHGDRQTSDFVGIKKRQHRVGVEALQGQVPAPNLDNSAEHWFSHSTRFNPADLTPTGFPPIPHFPATLDWSLIARKLRESFAETNFKNIGWYVNTSLSARLSLWRYAFDAILINCHELGNRASRPMFRLVNCGKPAIFRHTLALFRGIDHRSSTISWNSLNSWKFQDLL